MDIIVKIEYGSHLFGTATQDSDTDYKGVFLPSRNEILLGQIPKCRSFATKGDAARNTSEDVDEDIYSLHYFIKLASDGQVVAMDMLHAPKETLRISSEIWDFIVSQKSRFYTRKLKMFISYARRQAAQYGMKGERLNAASEVLGILIQEHPGDKLQVVMDRLPKNKHCHEIEPSPNNIRQYEICGKVFQETASIGYIIPVIERFVNEYGRRAKLAAENMNIDWKAISHALRAAIQTKEILTTGNIVFPLRDADFLRRVKQGLLDYQTEVAPLLDSLVDEVEKMMDESNLPEQVDIEYWNQFICDTLQKERFGK